MPNFRDLLYVNFESSSSFENYAWISIETTELLSYSELIMSVKHLLMVHELYSVQLELF